jgi:cation diffusion facilitator CzcD-associated flavoprotein CzcO
LDSQSTVGGVWAEHRLYPGLKTNNMRGNYEYGDFSFDDAGLHVKQGVHILGHEVHQYLRKYAEAFDIYDQIRFDVEVTTAEHLSEGRGWLLSTKSVGGDNPKKQIMARRLIVATGLTSDAFVPDIAGSQTRGAPPVIHVKDFQAHSKELFNKTKRATVLGGTKSAWDVCYAFASSGIPVDWVIRKSGHGPVWMSPAFANDKKSVSMERLVHTRFLSFFSPCIWGEADSYSWIRRFLHNTRLGRWCVRRFWQYRQSSLIRTNAYDEHEEVGKLKPWVDMFWIAGSLSILNYQTNFFDLVRDGMIKVHIADISALEENQIRLSNETVVPSDVLICSTGWRHRPAIQFLPDGIDSLIGIPHAGPNADISLVTRADAELMKRFPALRNQPRLNPHYAPMEGARPSESLAEPYRLYRFVVPPALYNERTLAFAGIVQSISTVYIAMAQGLWITAYFDGHDSTALAKCREGKEREEKVIWETMLHTQYGKWRCPGGYGSRFPDFVYDGMPYLDLLLRDLGLENKRKGGPWSELSKPYLTSDYAAIVDEWTAKTAREYKTF